MNQDDFIAKIFQSSVPLRRLDNNNLPTGFASGCLIDYSEKRILLTVSHATQDQQRWAIEIKYDANTRKTISYQVGAMNFLTSFSLKTQKVKDIDFSYAEVPANIQAFRQEVDEMGNIHNEVPIHVYQPNFEAVPNKKDKYGFAGTIKPCIEQHFNQTIVSSEFRIYHDLEYIRQEDEFYVFRLPIKHPGHDHFRGCSGSPILNEQGDIFALVCHGVEETDEIYGISLKKYKIALDILVGNID